VEAQALQRPLDVMQAILMLVRQVNEGRAPAQARSAPRPRAEICPRRARRSLILPEILRGRGAPGALRGQSPL
jgi:hypothetical protein